MKKVSFESVPIQELSKAVWNYKDEDDESRKRLTSSIREHGFIENLVVYENKDGGKIVLNGNHRLDSLRELQIQNVQICNMGKISENRAKKIAIQLNEGRFPNDMLKLAEILQELAKDPVEKDLLKDLPFSQKDLDQMIAGSGGSGGAGGSNEDLLFIKFSLTEDQVEAWLVWKREIGTENDTMALMKALEYAIIARKKEILQKPA